MDFEEYIQFVGIETFKAKKVTDNWRTETLKRVFKDADTDGSRELSVEEIYALTDPIAFDLESAAVYEISQKTIKMSGA